MAILLGSFLFGMLVLSPLLGAILTRQPEKPPARRPAPRPTAPATSAAPASERESPMRVEAEPHERRPPGPGISLSPEKSASVVHAADRIEEEQPKSEPFMPAPDPPVASNEMPPAATPPSGGSSVEESPAPPAPSSPPADPVQRPERIE